MIISISGAAGSGKSTVGERLAKELGWPRYYMGQIARDLAKKKGLTLAEGNVLSENDPQTDKEIDQYQSELGKTEDNFVIEGRTSWYFIPHSLKIYLDVSLEEGARRVFSNLRHNSQRNEDKSLENLEDVKASLLKRGESDRNRYNKYYGIDINDSGHYDLFLDATELSQEDEYQAVYKFVQSRLDNDKK